MADGISATEPDRTAVIDALQWFYSELSMWDMGESAMPLSDIYDETIRRLKEVLL